MILPKVKKKTIVIIASAAAFILIVFFFFYKFGFLRYYELKSQTKQLKEEIAAVDAKNNNLNAEIDSLRTKDSKIEKVAREKYHMIRKGEKTFRIDQK